MEVVDTLRMGKLDMFSFYKTRLKGSETFEWDGVKSVKSGLRDVTESYARKVVALLMKDE